jgi:formate dehydrogenase subunit gamma
MASIVTDVAARGRQVLVVRFTAAERLAHWVHFVAFTVLLGTGMFIFVPWFQPFTLGAAGEASRLAHRAAAVAFMFAPLLYLVFSPREFFYSLRESFTWGKDDWGWLQNAWNYYSRGRAGTMQPQGKYNAGQKLNALTQIITFVLFTLTGLAMWFGKGSIPPTAFQLAVIVHDLSVIATVLLFMLHLYLVAVHPLHRESITAMFEGTVTEEYAREHHGKWLAERVWRKRGEE